MAQHLEKCVVYQSRIAEDEDGEEKGGPTQQKLNLKQQPLRVRSISKEEQEKLAKDPKTQLEICRCKIGRNLFCNLSK